MAGTGLYRNRLLLDISLFYAFFLIGANYAMAGPILIELSERAGVSSGQMGYFFSSIALGSIAGALITTFLGKLNIRKWLFPVIYVLMPASNLLMAFSGNFASLIVSAVLIGLSLGLFEANGTVMLSEVNRQAESKYLLISQAFFGLGAFAGPMLISVLNKYGLSLSFSFAILAGMGFVNFMLIFFIKIPVISIAEASTIQDEASQSYKNLKTVLLFSCIFLAMFFYVSFESGISSWISTFLRQYRDFSIFIAGNAVAFFWLTIAAGRLLAGMVSGKIKATYLLLILSSLAAVTFKLASTLSGSIPIILLLTLTGIIMGGVWPLIVSVSIYFFPGLGRAVVPLVIVAGNIGGVLSPWIIGLMNDRYGLERGIRLVFIFSIIIVAFIAITVITEKYYKPKKAMMGP